MARKECLDQGGDLLELTDPDTDDEVGVILRQLEMDKGSYKVWIGLYRGSWKWTTGKMMS